MFATRFKKHYRIKLYLASQDPAPVESAEINEAQAAVFKKLIDQINLPDPNVDPVPKDLKDKIENTAIEMHTLRDAVRYAQDRLAAVLIAVTEQDLECKRLGMPEEYGERFHFYRGIIEDKYDKKGNNVIPRGQHIGDETWLQNASPQELFKECTRCVNERYYVEATWANMDKFIKVHNARIIRIANGGWHVYKKPEPKPEKDGKDDKDDKALVKFTGGARTARLARMGRAGRGGRGGGSVGRAEGSSFRGWKS